MKAVDSESAKGKDSSRELVRANCWKERSRRYGLVKAISAAYMDKTGPETGTVREASMTGANMLLKQDKSNKRSIDGLAKKSVMPPSRLMIRLTWNCIVWYIASLQPRIVRYLKRLQVSLRKPTH